MGFRRRWELARHLLRRSKVEMSDGLCDVTANRYFSG
jgi:hypothetical protein